MPYYNQIASDELDLGFGPDEIGKLPPTKPFYSLTWYKVEGMSITTASASFESREEIVSFQEQLSQDPTFAGILFQMEVV